MWPRLIVRSRSFSVHVAGNLYMDLMGHLTSGANRFPVTPFHTHTHTLLEELYDQNIGMFGLSIGGARKGYKKCETLWMVVYSDAADHDGFRL